MNTRSQEHEDETGLEEYDFLYIAPPMPSRNWRDRGAVRWTKIALWSLLILVGIGTLALVLYAVHALREAWRVIG
jgi:hypothetical protein